MLTVKTKICLLACSAFVSAPAFGALSVDFTLSDLQAPSYFVIHAPDVTSASQRVQPSATVAYNLPFGSLGDTVFDINFSAPAGQKFVLTVPLDVGTATPTLRFSALGGTAYTTTGSFTDTSPTVSILGATLNGNPVSPVDTSSRVSISGSPNNRLSTFAEFTFAPGDVFEFTSATISTIIPASFNNNMAGTFLVSNVYMSLGINAAGTNAFPDPGATVSLAAIPEPSTYLALSGFVAMGLFVINRRRQRAKE